MDGTTSVLTVGADTFVFLRGDQHDEILDFRSDEGDAMRFAIQQLSWSDLGTNRNGRLDGADRFISVEEGDTRIDHGAASRTCGRSEDVVRGR